jgi:hypothetical protein
MKVSLLEKMVVLGMFEERGAGIFTSYKLSCLETPEKGPKSHKRIGRGGGGRRRRRKGRG